jgi:hypothetical protein
MKSATKQRNGKKATQALSESFPTLTKKKKGDVSTNQSQNSAK